MLTPALRVRERSFRDDIAAFVRTNCRKYHIKRANVEDLTQEAMTEIVASIASFRQEKGDFDKWGRGVAQNVILRHVRDAKRYAARFSEYHPNVEEHPAPAPSPERCVQRTEARCKLSNAAAGLTDQQAEILVLHVVDGMSHKDIGAQLKISEGACQKRYQRARNHMAQCIVEEEVLSVIPLCDTSCNGISGSNDNASQWFELAKWSHYSGQLAAAIVAFMLFLPSNRSEQSHPSSSGAIRIAHGSAMYQHDKPIVYSNVLTGKLEPAPLPSVRAVAAPTRGLDKPASRQRAPLPSYNYSVHPAAHRRPNSR